MRNYASIPSGFGNMLEDKIKAKYKNQSLFAEKIGVTQATVSRYISGTATPSFNVLQRIAEALDIDLALFNPALHKKQEHHGVLKIPFYYSEVSAGKGISAPGSDHDIIHLDESWFSRQFLVKNSQDLFAVRVKGDSMEPLIQEGDIVIAQKHNSDRTQISSQEIYIVAFNDDFLIKKIQIKSRSIIKLISVNKEYDPLEIDLSEELTSFKIIAKVVGRINIRSFATG